MITRELFQLTNPVPAENHKWASEESARAHRFNASQHVTPSGITGRLLNRPPPGSDKDNQSLAYMPTPRKTMSGETDPSHDWNADSVRDGFKRLEMSQTSDVEFEMFEDVGGFAERKNLGDRK